MTRVLVIDDDPDIRRLIVYALSDRDYEVDEASDGQAALDLISKQHPHIIILDMRMPGVDGWEFARLYRDRYSRQAPIIVVTAARDAGQRGLDVNAAAHISKPFDLDVLVDQVAAVANTLVDSD